MTFAVLPSIRRGWSRGRVACILTLLIAAGCSGGGDTVSQEERDAAEGTARRAAEKLTGTLMGEVRKSIGEHGLAGAVDHCAYRAQELSAMIGAEEGVTIRRVTEKTRNPVDAPDSYERRILAQFAAMAQRGEINASTVHVGVVRENGTRMLRYLKPITVMEQCLGCHGSPGAIAEDVRTALRRHYPSDLATGYAEGDLRGAVSVLVPLQGK